MSNARIIQGRGLVAGTVEGTALVSQEPVSFLGDVDIVSGAIMGELPVLSKKWWEGRDFEAATLDIPNATGPYRLDRFEAGRYFVLKRDPNYWGKDLALKTLEQVDGLRALYVHELRATGVRSTAGTALAEPDAYYTLNRIPGRP